MQVECTTLHGDKKLIPRDKLILRAAAYAIAVHEGKILLMKTKSTGKYWFPGGGAELGEKLEDALKREVLEEAGIEIQVEKLLTFKELFFYYEPHDKAYHNYSFFFLCKPVTTQLVADNQVDPEDESEKPRWVEIVSVTPEEVQTGAQGVLQLVKELL